MRAASVQNVRFRGARYPRGAWQPSLRCQKAVVLPGVRGCAEGVKRILMNSGRPSRLSRQSLKRLKRQLKRRRIVLILLKKIIDEWQSGTGPVNKRFRTLLQGPD